MPEAGTHAARNGIGGPGNWTTGVQQVSPEEWRVARNSGEWSVVSESQGRELAATEKRQTKPIAWGANRWWTVTYGERGRN